MQTVCVIGGNSFIGKHLLAELQKQHFVIHALFHKHPLEFSPSMQKVFAFPGDLLQIETLRAFIVSGATVINLAYLAHNTVDENITAIKNLAEVCAEKKVKRLIHCSTAMVHGANKNLVIDEDSGCNPRSEYEKTKYNIEKILLTYKTQFELAILRPTAVIGPYGKNLVKLAQDLRMRSSWLNYLKSCCMAKRNMHLIGVKNVVAAIVFLVQVQDLKNKTHFLITQDQSDKNIFNFVESYLLKALQLPRYVLPVIPLPLFFLSILHYFFKQNAANPRQVYLGKNLSLLGFKNQEHLPDSLLQFCDWYGQQESRYENPQR